MLLAPGIHQLFRLAHYLSWETHKEPPVGFVKDGLHWIYFGIRQHSLQWLNIHSKVRSKRQLTSSLQGNKGGTKRRHSLSSTWLIT